MAIGSILHNPKRKLIGININQENIETIYMVGESFDPTNLIITVDYINEWEGCDASTQSEVLDNASLNFYPQIFLQTATDFTINFSYSDSKYDEIITGKITGLKIIDKIPTWSESSWDDIHRVCQMRAGGQITDRIWNNYVQIGNTKELLLNYPTNIKYINKEDTPIPTSCTVEVIGIEIEREKYTDGLPDLGSITFQTQQCLYLTPLYDNADGKIVQWISNENKLYEYGCKFFYKAMNINKNYLKNAWKVSSQFDNTQTFCYAILDVLIQQKVWIPAITEISYKSNDGLWKPLSAPSNSSAISYQGELLDWQDKQYQITTIDKTALCLTEVSTDDETDNRGNFIDPPTIQWWLRTLAGIDIEKDENKDITKTYYSFVNTRDDFESPVGYSFMITTDNEVRGFAPCFAIH